MAKNKSYLIAFGINLKKILEDRGMTPEDVAAHARVETKQVYRIINGEHSTGIDLIYSIAKGIGVTPKTLFDFEFVE